MNTFLPYSDFKQSAKCLDWRRCGKQRVEAFQILKIISGEKTKGGYIHHPAVLMWSGYSDALRLYLKCVIEEWISRGYKNNIEIPNIKKDIEMPYWMGDERFHSAHRSNLLRKDYNYYSQFGWDEGQFLEYYWPPKKKCGRRLNINGENMILINKTRFLEELKTDKCTIGVGIGTTRPKKSDTALEFPIGHRIPFTSYEEVDNKISIVGFFPQATTVNFDITEAGIFSESGQLLYRETHKPKTWGYASRLTVSFIFDIEVERQR